MRRTFDGHFFLLHFASPSPILTSVCTSHKSTRGSLSAYKYEPPASPIKLLLLQSAHLHHRLLCHLDIPDLAKNPNCAILRSASRKSTLIYFVADSTGPTPIFTSATSYSTVSTAPYFVPPPPLLPTRKTCRSEYQHLEQGLFLTIVLVRRRIPGESFFQFSVR